MNLLRTKWQKALFISSLLLGLASCGQPSQFAPGDSAERWDSLHLTHPDHESHSEENPDHETNTDLPDELMELGCTRANATQLSVVNSGNQKKDEFLSYCRRQTDNSTWCDQLVRPNPDSKSIFNCTYGSSQVHQLIYPDQNTWSYPVNAVKLIQKLQSKGIKVCEIYNWWRPEPYNKNVGGAAGRHPYGTSVDVRFCSSKDAVKGFDELCVYRKQGLIRAIGYYGGSGVHFGIGDKTANTWGRSCR